MLEDFGDEIIFENFKKVIVLGLHALKINNQGLHVDGEGGR
jgi:hypothetical protein